eukprot:m51a1_g7955 hypothetical protein (798) ;mRNA; f:184965-188029
MDADAASLLGGEQNINLRFNVKYWDGTSKVLEVPLRSTVDRLKREALLSRLSEGIKWNDYVLCVSETEGLDVEYRKLVNAHPAILESLENTDEATLLLRRREELTRAQTAVQQLAKGLGTPPSSARIADTPKSASFWKRMLGSASSSSSSPASASLASPHSPHAQSSLSSPPSHAHLHEEKSSLSAEADVVAVLGSPQERAEVVAVVSSPDKDEGASASVSASASEDREASLSKDHDDSTEEPSEVVGTGTPLTSPPLPTPSPTPPATAAAAVAVPQAPAPSSPPTLSSPVMSASTVAVLPAPAASAPLPASPVAPALSVVPAPASTPLSSSMPSPASPLTLTAPLSTSSPSAAAAALSTSPVSPAPLSASSPHTSARSLRLGQQRGGGGGVAPAGSPGPERVQTPTSPSLACKRQHAAAAGWASAQPSAPPTAQHEAPAGPLIVCPELYNLCGSSEGLTPAAAEQMRQEIEEAELFEPWYRDHFSGRDHADFVCELEGAGNVAVVSVARVGGGSSGSDAALTRWRVLYRARKGDAKKVVVVRGKGVPIKEICAAVDPGVRIKRVTQVKHAESDRLLQEFEDRQMIRSFKIGVVYCKEGDASEEDMFCNRDASEQMEEFLSLLGERVQLRGWQKYRAGLDARGGATGEQSLYTVFRGFELMFHVATMLPYTPNDRQQVEKKRHIGNDICVIVFKEGPAPYPADRITSEFNQVYGVVQAYKVNGQTAYRAEFAAKDGVPPFRPPTPTPCCFTNPRAFREFLLCKMINGEIAAYHSPTFKLKIQRTRAQLLANLSTSLK